MFFKIYINCWMEINVRCLEQKQGDRLEIFIVIEVRVGVLNQNGSNGDIENLID